jgi:hypothetical protein
MDANQTSKNAGPGADEAGGIGPGGQAGPHAVAPAAKPAAASGGTPVEGNPIVAVVVILGGLWLFCALCDWLGRPARPLEPAGPPVQAVAPDPRSGSPYPEVYTGLSPEEKYLAQSMGRPYSWGVEEMDHAIQGLTTGAAANPGYNGTSPYADYYP